MPVEMEHGLACVRPDVDDHAVVVEPFCCGDRGNKAEHPGGLPVRKGVDLAEGVDVTFGQHEQVRLRGRGDVADSNEAVSRPNVVTPATSRQKRQSGRDNRQHPFIETPTARARDHRADGASTSQGV